MADSDREEALDQQGLAYDFGLSQDARLQGLLFRLYPWQPAGPAVDPDSVLRARLTINGADHHLEAMAVHYHEADGCWYPDAEAWDLKFIDFMAAAGAGDPFERTPIGEREYVLVMTPYCE